MALLVATAFVGTSTAGALQRPHFDYGTGYTLINKTALSADHAEHFYPALHAIEPSTFDLDYFQEIGLFIMDSGILEIDDVWSIAWGTHRTLEQSRWFVVLFYADEDEYGSTRHRVAARLVLEDTSLPASGNEVRHALGRSIRIRGVSVELRARRARTERADHSHF